MKSLDVTGDGFARALVKLGFVERGRTSVAVALEHDGHMVVVPLGRDDLDPETIARLLLMARVGHDELTALLTPTSSGVHAIGPDVLGRLRASNDG